MQKLFAILTALMMFTSAASAKENDTQLAKASFNKMAQSIISEIQKSYKNQDTAVIYTTNLEGNVSEKNLQTNSNHSTGNLISGPIVILSAL